MNAEITKVEMGEDGMEVTVDIGGGDLSTALVAAAPGDLSYPRVGDLAVLEEGDEPGVYLATGFVDQTVQSLVAASGEVYRFGRDSDGAPSCHVHLKANGDVEVKSLKSGGKIILNGVEIDQDGNMTAPGEVTAMSANAGTAVKLSTHLHPTSMGPTDKPTPGT